MSKMSNLPKVSGNFSKIPASLYGMAHHTVPTPGNEST